MSDRMAPCLELTTMVDVYPEDKRVAAVVPVAAFTGPIEAFTRGDEVTLTGGADWRGKPDPSTGTAVGRVKRVLVEVEVDLSTFKPGEAKGQGSLV